MSSAIVGGALAGVVASLLTLLGVLVTNRWRIAAENIIEQRAEWRNAVRSLVGQAMETDDPAKLRRIWAELALRMNPDPDPRKDDRQLVELVGSLVLEENRTDPVRRRIVALAAHILKHDWSRAKWEAQGWFWEDEPEQTAATIDGVAGSPAEAP